MTRVIPILGRAVWPVAIACALSLADSLAVFLTLGTIPRATLVLVLFLEGGAGLLTGVAIALSGGPSVSKMGEVVMGTSPWSRGTEKHAMKMGNRWILTSILLLVIGFLLSAV